METAATPSLGELTERRATFLAKQRAECLDILAGVDDRDLSDAARAQLAAKLDESWVVELVMHGKADSATPRRAWVEWCKIALVVGADYPFEVRRRRLAKGASNVSVMCD